MGSEPEPTGLWSVLPPSLRTATVLAVLTAVVAGTLLYRSTSTSSELAEGGPQTTADGDTSLGDLTIPTPTPRPGATARSRSEAVLTAPDDPDNGGRTVVPGGSKFPAFGTYIYDVEGTESAGAFGSRQYPPELTMVVHRSPASDGAAPELEDDELAFDLFFSEEHEEHEVVAFRRSGISFTYEASAITFGPVEQMSRTSYDPPIVQVPRTLEENATVEGTSRAISPEGEERRVEDWTLTVVGAESIDVMGEDVTTWVIQLERDSRSGSAEQIDRSRTYWFDPGRSIWVKWTETTTSTQDFGPGSFTYRSEYTATLDRIEPL